MKLIDVVGQITKRLLLDLKVPVFMHVVNVQPLRIERNAVIAISIEIFPKCIGVRVAALADVPAQGPLRQESRTAENCTLVHLEDIVRLVAEQEEDLADTASSSHRDVDDTSLRMIPYRPVLRLSQIREHSKPLLVARLRHEERMSAAFAGPVPQRVRPISQPKILAIQTENLATISVIRSIAGVHT